jgi:hypothetical protein
VRSGNAGLVAAGQHADDEPACLAPEPARARQAPGDDHVDREDGLSRKHRLTTLQTARHVTHDPHEEVTGDALDEIVGVMVELSVTTMYAGRHFPRL